VTRLHNSLLGVWSLEFRLLHFFVFFLFQAAAAH
jgi:hypothetical protein